MRRTRKEQLHVESTACIRSQVPTARFVYEAMRLPPETPNPHGAIVLKLVSAIGEIERDCRIEFNIGD